MNKDASDWCCLCTDDAHACRPCADELLLAEVPGAVVLALALLYWVKAAGQQATKCSHDSNMASSACSLHVAQSSSLMVMRCRNGLPVLGWLA